MVGPFLGSCSILKSVKDERISSLIKELDQSELGEIEKQVENEAKNLEG